MTTQQVLKGRIIDALNESAEKLLEEETALLEVSDGDDAEDVLRDRFNSAFAEVIAEWAVPGALPSF